VTVAGTYNYVCTPHAGMGMVGSFVATAPAPFLNVTPSNQNVTSSVGSTSFSVSSNIAWNASSDQSWCTVTASGNGNGTITANYSENTLTSQRIATITVSGSGVSNQVVTVTQSGAAKTLLVSPPSQAVSSAAGTTDFSVSSNSDWSASSDATWCTVTSSGTGNGMIVATFGENTEYTSRTANITVTVSGLSPVIVHVVQDASTVGIPEKNGVTVQLYPNPAKDFVKISLENIDKNARVSLIDLTGKVITDESAGIESEIKFNVQELPRGYYFVRIISGNEIITRRLILSE
jgi:hypothetical protein